MTASRLWPSASIVINTYNRASYIEDALKALQWLDYPRYEVVVVNGPSTDNTAEILARWASRVKLATCDEANLSKSRNVGIRATSGDLIAFMDDDAVPHPSWLKRIAEVFRDESVGAAGGFTVDNTGVRWQVRKTLCDRYGNAFNVSDYFDERAVCFPGTPYYPSLLGTNSCFRAAALRAIGGFDEVFAYLLDETDVCLRLVDAGWKVCYEPGALIYHQFAESHIRTRHKVARTLYPSATSKAYFIMRHGARQSLDEAARQLDTYRREIGDANKWLEAETIIDGDHRYSLDQDLLRGVEAGQSHARRRGDRTMTGDLDQLGATHEFSQYPHGAGFRLILVSQSFPPANDAGIARWTSMLARGLADRGHAIHVIARAEQEESVRFADGYWVHRVKPNGEGAPQVAERYNIPENIAAWSARVMREITYLKSFGAQLISFPIWDLEALPVLDDPELVPVVSLHTTYKMAKPFKPEWNLRPLYEFNMVDRMIAAEGDLLRRAPRILANSQAIVSILESGYGVDLAGRHEVIAHGTQDPLACPERAHQAAARVEQMMAGDRLRVLYVGRFEPRKGFDIAAAVAQKLCRDGNIEVRFVGDTLGKDWERRLRIDGTTLDAGENTRFLGVVERDALDDAYADADVVLTPSRFESFGLVAIEAMAAGRPVLVVDAGGLGEVVRDGIDGLKFADGDGVADRIAEAVRALERDRPRLRRLGEAARRSFEERYTVEKMVEGVERFYWASLTPAAEGGQS